MGLAFLALVALFWLMEQLASVPVSSDTTSLVMISPSSQPVYTNTPLSPSVSSTPTLSPDFTPTQSRATSADSVIARVDDVTITQARWRTALLLDGVMSQLTQQPLPSAEETLQRLINEQVILRAAQLESVPLPIAEAEARVRRIQEAFGIGDQRLNEILASHGLRWADLIDYTARLILVERGMETLRARHGDFDRWLTQARADASIVVYAVSGIPWGEDIAPTVARPEVTSSPTTAVVRKAPSPAQETHLVAPDFTLSSAQGISVTLRNYRHRAAVVLVFYRGQT
ncbi:MAG: hypothetical protein NZ765_01810 [Anaerolineae bacterium]|nr:hypothetical protein [Anaerolineae bacterium]MDW8069997.1 hypothetical protein [Anaerolineae bacterium]